MRATMKIPAVTIVAAWISAEIGVGPSIESGSQTCSGACADLPMAPMNSRMQTSVIAFHGWPGRIDFDLCGNGVGLAEHVGVVERAREHHDRRDAENKAEVADAVDEEGLQVREDRTSRA